MWSKCRFPAWVPTIDAMQRLTGPGWLGIAALVSSACGQRKDEAAERRRDRTVGLGRPTAKAFRPPSQLTGTSPYQGEFVSLMGQYWETTIPAGSTTRHGKVVLNGNELRSPTDRLSDLRLKTIGFVFQAFNLIPAQRQDNVAGSRFWTQGGAPADDRHGIASLFPLAARYPVSCRWRAAASRHCPRNRNRPVNLTRR
jgi:hypothetical protein